MFYQAFGRGAYRSDNLERMIFFWSSRLDAGVFILNKVKRLQIEVPVSFERQLRGYRSHKNLVCHFLVCIVGHRAQRHTRACRNSNTLTFAIYSCFKFLSWMSVIGFDKFSLLFLIVMNDRYTPAVVSNSV